MRVRVCASLSRSSLVCVCLSRLSRLARRAPRARRAPASPPRPPCRGSARSAVSGGLALALCVAARAARAPAVSRGARGGGGADREWRARASSQSQRERDPFYAASTHTIEPYGVHRHATAYTHTHDPRHPCTHTSVSL